MSAYATIKCRTNHVLVHLKGDSLPPQEILPIMAKAIELASESHIDVLVLRDAPVKHGASTFGFSEYVEYLTQSGFRGRLALAFPEEMHDENFDFFVTAARNRMIDMKLFVSEGEAVHWLENDREKGV